MNLQAAERSRAVLEYAKAAFVAESVYRDPSLTKGIDNILLLLLQRVLQNQEDQTCLPDNIGLYAGDQLVLLLRQHSKLPRFVRRWLTEHKFFFTQLGEYMVEALRHDPVPEPPAGPKFGDYRYVEFRVSVRSPP